MPPLVVLLLALLAGQLRADDPCISMPLMAPPTAVDLPLCGNGVLEAGELCDDGNRVGGDGCNAWCTGFDRMTKACTLAGQNANSQCNDGGRPPGSMSASTAAFCRLSAVAASPDGAFVVVADRGFLIRLELFTDNLESSLTTLPATLIQPFARFCMLSVLDGGRIVAHECAEQSLVVFFNGGTQYTKAFALPLLPAQRMRGLQDGEMLVTAGVPSSSSSCVQVCPLLSLPHLALTGAGRCTASIPQARLGPSWPPWTAWPTM